jgi:hypothetical protein
MNVRRWTTAAFSVMMLAAAGCGGEAPPPKRASFLENNPWVVRKPEPRAVSDGGDTGANNPTTPATPVKPRKDPKAEVYRPDSESEVVHPIFEADGKWTVRVAFYHPDNTKGLSALHYANDAARTMRKNGYEAYVTDLQSLAIVSIGSFKDEHDPELIKLWNAAYDDWLKIHGGKNSAFREKMQEFYGDKTVFGDQPWPVRIIELQVKMKLAYKITPTDDENKRYQEFMNARKSDSANP